MNKSNWLWGVLCAVLIFIDQISKYAALILLKPLGSSGFIPGFLRLSFVENRGAAFGILQGQRLIFVVFTVVVAVAIIYYFIKIPNEKNCNKLKFSLILILAGAVGNCIDRICRGYVIDFFDFEFMDFYVFNVADICVVIGIILLAVFMLFVFKEDPAGLFKDTPKEEQK